MSETTKPGSSSALALFDFDGTITTKDTLWAFIQFAKGSKALLSGAIQFGWPVLLYKLGMVGAQDAKEKVLAYYFSHATQEEFNGWCGQFAENALPALVRPRALETIQWHKQRGDEVAIVSASPENWIKPWASRLGVETIASILQVNQGRLTGKIDGVNCNGMEKVRRIKSRFSLEAFQEIYAYGDSSGDKDMLKLAHYQHFKPFRTSDSLLKQ
jgi:HAD superfamily hydrolase (TIGR01490 family)